MADNQTQPTRSPDTDEIVRGLLLARKGQWRRIAEESRVVSYSWVTKFMSGEIPNAGSQTLKELRAWLEANPPQFHPQTSAPSANDAGVTSAPGAASEPPA